MSPQPEFSCLKSTKTPAKLTINTPERRHCVVNDVLLSLLSFLNRFHTLFWFFYYLLWTSKCRLGINVKFLFQTFFHFMEIANKWINVSIRYFFRQLIAVLAQDGIIRFIDPHTCQLQSEVGSSARVSRIINCYCKQIKLGRLLLTSYFSSYFFFQICLAVA